MSDRLDQNISFFYLLPEEFFNISSTLVRLNEPAVWLGGNSFIVIKNLVANA